MITIIHYLYLLTVAWAARVHISEVGDCLGELLREDSEIAVFLRSRNNLEELSEIYQCCRRLYPMHLQVQ